MQHDNNAENRWLALDGLRGWAILLVMLYHFTDLQYHTLGERATEWDRLLHRFCEFGWVGVDLFFVLSGFLITGILLKTRGHTGYFRSFLGRRALRIFPLYYGLLFAILILLPRFTSLTPDALKYLENHQVWYWTYTTNFLYAQHGSFRGVTGGYFWSLAVEEQFYLLWPVVVALLPSRYLQRLCLALFGLSALGRMLLLSQGWTATAVYVLPFTHLEPLVLGAWLACRVNQGENQRSYTVHSLAIASVGILIGVGVLRNGFRFWDPVVVAISPSLLAIIGCSLVSWALQSDSRCWTLSPLVSLGTVSYGLYLFHLPVAFVVLKVLPKSGILPILLAFAGSWLVAYLSWRLFERPILSLKRYLPRPEKPRITATPQPAVAGVFA